MVTKRISGPGKSGVHFRFLSRIIPDCDGILKKYPFLGEVKERFEGELMRTLEKTTVVFRESDSTAVTYGNH